MTLVQVIIDLMTAIALTVSSMLTLSTPQASVSLPSPTAEPTIAVVTISEPTPTPIPQPVIPQAYWILKADFEQQRANHEWNALHPESCYVYYNADCDDGSYVSDQWLHVRVHDERLAALDGVLQGDAASVTRLLNSLEWGRDLHRQWYDWYRENPQVQATEGIAMQRYWMGVYDTRITLVHQLAGW